METNKKDLVAIGWREWVSFPELGIETIKAKIDTGARTSALHASNIRISKRTNEVTFTIHPAQRHRNPVINATAELVEERLIKSSNGETTQRPVIKTKLKIGKKSYFIELTLLNRDLMGFRLLLGRCALKKRFLVDSGESFLMGEKSSTKKSSTKKPSTKKPSTKKPSTKK